MLPKFNQLNSIGISNDEHLPVISSHRAVCCFAGTTGLDYPNLTQVPLTRFTCKHQYRTGGYYADVEAGCQVRL